MCIRDSLSTRHRIFPQYDISEAIRPQSYSPTESVSYTHLDVYKRQSPPAKKSGPNIVAAPAIICKETLPPIAHRRPPKLFCNNTHCKMIKLGNLHLNLNTVDPVTEVWKIRAITGTSVFITTSCIEHDGEFICNPDEIAIPWLRGMPN